MVLIKLNADNEKRGEILQLANIFNVKTVDVGVDQMTIETTGDSKNIESLLELLEPYWVLEVMRTGRVAVLKSLEWKENKNENVLWKWYRQGIN